MVWFLYDCMDWIAVRPEASSAMMDAESGRSAWARTEPIVAKSPHPAVANSAWCGFAGANHPGYHASAFRCKTRSVNGPVKGSQGCIVVTPFYGAISATLESGSLSPSIRSGHSAR